MVTALVLLPLFLCPLLPQRAAALSYVMVSDEDLVEQAAVIAEVQITASSLAPLAGNLATEYAATVVRQLKGEYHNNLVVRVPGGVRPDGIELQIWGMPRFKAGERVLLFLEPRSDQSFRILHLMLGAFHEVWVGGKRRAVRDLREANRVRMSAEGLVADEQPEQTRDFDRWSDWIADRAAGRNPAVDYITSANPDTTDLAAAAPATAAPFAPPFTLFDDPDTGLNIRWFEFDSGQVVPWYAHEVGQQGLSGGGYAEFQSALQAWNAHARTPIAYHYAGLTDATAGLFTFDELNSILFNDPNDELSPYSCTTGGVLAYGGPWYTTETQEFQGQRYHPIVKADIVINDGLECFFTESPNASQAAAELFGHELGHTLALGHACGDQGLPSCSWSVLDQALMRSFIHDDQRGARLNKSDRAALARLYQQGLPMPEAPSHLTAVALSNTAIQIEWTDNAKKETGYVVEVRSADGSFFTIAPQNSTRLIIAGLVPATRYAVRARAVNVNAFSPYSDTAETKTLKRW